ncbi:MAG: DNA-binding protein [Planctomycetes bacterium]|nr:DNA-binding protein [Planctomycetota bacterium]
MTASQRTQPVKIDNSSPCGQNPANLASAFAVAERFGEHHDGCLHRNIDRQSCLSASECQSDVAALQNQARDWWHHERPKFNLATSQLVINEASVGDPSAASDRSRLLAGIPLVPSTPEVQNIAKSLVSAAMMPPKAAADALHFAAAAFAGVEYLLTQNCRHIANAHILPQVYAKRQLLGFGGLLLICTPAEFFGEVDNENEPDS